MGPQEGQAAADGAAGQEDAKQSAEPGTEVQMAAKTPTPAPSGSPGESMPSAPAPQPQNGYAIFREMLKHSSAVPVTKKLIDFVQKFPAGLPRHEAARRVHKFLSNTQEWMLSDVVVFAAEADEEGRTNAAEGLEKFLVIRLHPKLFAVDPLDGVEDVKLQKHIDGLAWVRFEHLGIPPVDPSLLSLAVNELQRIDNYKAPRDKLVCILNACRVISDVLKRTLEESSRQEAGGDSGVTRRAISADDFLPLLILTVIMANPPRLHSNLEFVAAFRHPTRLVAEDAYFLTALQSAMAFVKEAGPKTLDVTPEEYDRRYAASLGEQRHNSQRPVLSGAQLDGVMPEPAPGPPLTAASKARELGTFVRQSLAERLRAMPFKFEAVQSARDLRIDQIAGLLEEYTAMAALLRDVERGTLVGTPGESK